MRIRFIALCLVALVSSGLLPASAGAQAATGHLSGLVENQRGVALPASQLRLTDGSGVTNVIADENGRYSAALRPGVFDLAVSAIDDDVPLEAKVRAVEVGQDTKLNLVLTEGPSRPRTLTGTLRDAEGAPISGASISAGGLTVTDEDGVFVLEVPWGHYHLLVMLPLDGGDVQVGVQDFDLTQDRHVDLILPLISIDVTVRDEAGSVLQGAEVHASEPCGGCPSAFELFPGARTGRSWDIRGYTGANGHVRVVGLPTSGLSLSARIPNGYYESVDRTGLSATASKSFDVVLPTSRQSAEAKSFRSASVVSTSVSFSGSLDFAGMHDPDDAYLSVGGQHAYVAPHDGTFGLSTAAGSYTLDVSAASWENGDDWEWRPVHDSVSLAVNPFALEANRHEDMRLPLVPFSFRVLDHVGVPVPGAWVESVGGGNTSGEVYPGAQTTGDFRSDRWTDANGVATLQVLPGVAFTVSVDPPGGRGLPAEVQVSSTSTSAEVRVEDAPALQGRIRTPEGRAVRPRHGSLIPESGPQRSFTFGEDGSYAVSALPGRYRIALDSEDDFYRPSEDDATWSLHSSSFELTDDSTLDLTVAPSEFYDEMGRVEVVDADGRRLEGGEFDSDARGSSIGDFELAPGIRARSGVSIFGPGGWYPLAVPVLAPSRVGTNFEPYDGNPDLELPALYVAPGELTVVAYVLGSDRRTPFAPGNLRGRPDGETTATVTWSPPEKDSGSPIRGYVVSRGHGRPVFVTATTAVLTGLVPGSTYRFAVAAVNARGLGETRTTDPILTAGTRPSPPPVSRPPVVIPKTPAPITTTVGPPATRSGYWMVGSDGKVYPFGDARHLGEPVNDLGSAEAVDLEPSSSGNGYWVLDERGRVYAYGDAAKFGDAEGLAAGEKATSLSAAGTGYWVFTSAGRVLPFGDAKHYGDMAGVRLNGPVLDSVATPSGKGYYMVGSDGGVFTFGDAVFSGSMGDRKLNAPVQSLVPDGDGDGYWLVASDGGIFAFDASFKGSMGGTKLNRPVTGMVRFGNGYLMVGEDGGIFNFSDKAFNGSLGANPPARPIVGVAARDAGF